MSSKAVLKNAFSTGNQATASSFSDLIDSSYNTTDDSVLLGPAGYTGVYGLIGPTGGTGIGLFISSKVEDPTFDSEGTVGEVYFSTSGPTPYVYFCTGPTSWIQIQGATSF